MIRITLAASRRPAAISTFGELFRREQQEDAGDQHVAILQSLDGVGRGGQAGDADVPAGLMAGIGHSRLSQASIRQERR
ncbi:hypothetical protein A5906_30015 [Bradyrhizobium sacchari]|nr:hypothetical protein A5906_30015 [Bradyrhizobium sacchari]